MRTDPHPTRARRYIDLWHAWWPAVVLLATWCGVANAADGAGECANVNIEITARVTPWRHIVESQDTGDSQGRDDRCATLSRMLTDLTDVRAAFEDRRETPGGDLSCDQATATLDNDAAWLAQHDRALGCNLEK